MLLGGQGSLLSLDVAVSKAWYLDGAAKMGSWPLAISTVRCLEAEWGGRKAQRMGGCIPRRYTPAQVWWSHQGYSTNRVVRPPESVRFLPLTERTTLFLSCAGTEGPPDVCGVQGVTEPESCAGCLHPHHSPHCSWAVNSEVGGPGPRKEGALPLVF